MKCRKCVKIRLRFHYWLPKKYDFFLISGWQSNYGDFRLREWRFSAMPKWRRLRTNDGGLTCMLLKWQACFSSRRMCSGVWPVRSCITHNWSPKDDERMRCAGVGSTKYNIAINSPLPSRDAILKNKLKYNKRQLSRVLSTFNMGAAVTIDTQDTGLFGHEEADVTIISYVLQAVGEGNNVVRVLCDDTDVFVLLVFCMWRNQLVDTCQMQTRWSAGMERYSRSTRRALQMHSVAWNARLVATLHPSHWTKTKYRPWVSLKLDTSLVYYMSSERKTPCDGTFWRFDFPSCGHCTARNQAHPWKRTEKRRPGSGFAILRRIAPTCFFMCNGPTCRWHCGSQLIGTPRLI